MSHCRNQPRVMGSKQANKKKGGSVTLSMAEVEVNSIYKATAPVLPHRIKNKSMVVGGTFIIVSVGIHQLFNMSPSVFQEHILERLHFIRVKASGSRVLMQPILPRPLDESSSSTAISLLNNAMQQTIQACRNLA